MSLDLVKERVLLSTCWVMPFEPLVFNLKTEITPKFFRKPLFGKVFDKF